MASRAWRLAVTAVKKTAREKRSEESQEKAKGSKQGANKAELKEEADRFVLDDSIRKGELVLGEGAV